MRIRKLLEKRILSPNNATTEFVSYLKDSGIIIKNTTNSRKYAEIEGKKYSITITSADSNHVECRQHNLDGVITFYEKNGQVYLIDNKDLDIGSKTREMNDNKYSNAKSKRILKMHTPSRKIKQINKDEYKRTYIDVAVKVGESILGNVYNKIK